MSFILFSNCLWQFLKVITFITFLLFGETFEKTPCKFVSVKHKFKFCTHCWMLERCKPSKRLRQRCLRFSPIDVNFLGKRVSTEKSSEKLSSTYWNLLVKHWELSYVLGLTLQKWRWFSSKLSCNATSESLKSLKCHILGNLSLDGKQKISMIFQSYLL